MQLAREKKSNNTERTRDELSVFSGEPRDLFLPYGTYLTKIDSERSTCLPSTTDVGAAI